MPSLKSAFARVLCGAIVVLSTCPAWSAVVWDESTNGDLSNDRLHPTPIDLAPGTNSLVANVGLNGDLDYVTVNVPANSFLSGLTLVSYTGPGGAPPEDGTAFIGMEAGNQITVPTNVFTAAGLMGWAHFGTDAFGPGTNILPDMAQSDFGSSGFTPPVASGAYSFWIQQLGDVEVDYQFDFQITTGDYNGDHVVDAADYVIWRHTLGQTVAIGSGADGDGSTVIDAADYTLWQSQFGNTTAGAGRGAGAVVPEPTAAVLAIFGSVSLAFGIRRLQLGRIAASARFA